MISDHDILEAVSSAVGSGRGVAIPVSGRSMGPNFASVRDIVVEPFDPSAIRLGNIIAFQRGGRWVVHRVMWKLRRAAGAFCITKGDNLCKLDRPYVRASEIKGIVAGLDTNGGVVNLKCTARRLAGWYTVMRGWLTVGRSFLRASRHSTRS